MSQKFLNLVKTAIFYNFLKVWKKPILKTRPSHRVFEKGLGIASFMTSFQAIDLFLVINYVPVALDSQETGKCQINALFLVAITDQVRQNVYRDTF